jgi:hypothetical protein
VPRPPARRGPRAAAHAPCGKMAPAGCGCGCRGGTGVWALQLLLLLLLSVLVSARATEHYSPLSLLKQELQHRQSQEAPVGGGCPQSGDWADQYPTECGEWDAPRRPPHCGRGGRAWTRPGGGGDRGRRRRGPRPEGVWLARA